MNLQQKQGRRSIYVLIRFVVRDFVWDPTKLSQEKKMHQELIVAERDQKVF
jgi:hypothetical protein